MGCNTLEVTDSYAYLGIIFEEFLTFEKCAKTLSDSAGRALSAVISKFKRFRNIGFNTFTKLYYAGVNTILHYGASVWGFSNYKFGQQIQNRAVKYFLGVHKNAPNLAVQADMGWLNVKYHYHVCAIRYWNRLLQMDTERLTRQLFEHQLVNLSDYNWCGEIYKIMDEINRTEIISSGSNLSMTDIINDFFDLMHMEWSNNVGFKPNLRYYAQFKQDVDVEKYVKFSMTRSQRSLLAQLRMGILPLHIETGRYYRKPLQERVCLYCSDDIIEDEYHFLCCCTAYYSERDQLYRKLKTVYPNFDSWNLNEKFIAIMSFDTNYLAKFVKKIWNIRKNIVLN